MFSVIRSFDPIEVLEKEYDDTKYYNFILHVGISQGQYEVVWKFLEKVPCPKKKGKISRQLILSITLSVFL